MSANANKPAKTTATKRSKANAPSPTAKITVPRIITTNLHSLSPSKTSPLRVNIPHSPVQSIISGAPSWMEDRYTRASVDVSRGDHPPPVPNKGEKRLPMIPGQPPLSPHRSHSKGAFAGAYDNKLLPPLPPSSPTPTGPSGISHSTSQRGIPRNTSAPLLKNPSLNIITTGLSSISPRPSFSHPSSSSGVVVLPDGTALATTGSGDGYERHADRGEGAAGVGRSVLETMVHSSPSSPWSLLTVHVLPLFAGGALKTPIEDLNQLCHSHIIATAQRAQPSRIVALLTSDFREFVGSGMLTLKSKFETLEEGKIIARAAEVWSFFWGQVLPYLEGVFLPFTQVQDLPSISHASSISPASMHPIPVRRILLSGFLIHILLPLVSRLIPLVASTPMDGLPPTTSDLQRLLQMSLVLSTQARLSMFLPAHERRDEEIRLNVEDLGKTVRWRMQRGPDGMSSSDVQDGTANNRLSLQRNTSLNNGRYRRKGWRASSNFGQSWGIPSEQSQPMISRQMSENNPAQQAPEARWGRPRVDEEDEDDVTPGQSLAYPRNTMRDDSTYSSMPSTLASTVGASTFTTSASTVRGESVATNNDLSQRTPQAEHYNTRQVTRMDSNDGSELTPVVNGARR